jgi:hypothetical protein
MILKLCSAESHICLIVDNITKAVAGFLSYLILMCYLNKLHEMNHIVDVVSVFPRVVYPKLPKRLRWNFVFGGGGVFLRYSSGITSYTHPHSQNSTWHKIETLWSKAFIWWLFNETNDTISECRVDSFVTIDFKWWSLTKHGLISIIIFIQSLFRF